MAKRSKTLKVRDKFRTGSGIIITLDDTEQRFVEMMCRSMHNASSAKSILKKIQEAESTPHEEEL